MQTSLETLGQLERRLTMSVPIAAIESEIEQRLQQLAKNVKVPGFRPGKVPLKLVAQQYGPKVRSDVISDTVQNAFSEAMREKNLRIAGYPRIEPKTDATAPDQMEFSAVFEVYPEVDIGDLSDVVIQRPVTEVRPEDIKQTIEMLRRQRTRYETADRAAASGDRVIVDFVGRIDSVAFPGGTINGHSIVIGEGKMLPGFEGAIIGMSAGETKTFELTFPADYHGTDVAGKTAEFTLTAKHVERGTLPDIDADFAKAFGIASGKVADLEREIASNLNLELKRKLEAKLKEQVFAALRQRANFVLPRALVEMEAQSLAQRMAEEMRQQGAKPEDLKISPETFRTSAEARVALGLVLSEVVRANGISAKPEQVRALVEESAQTYELPEAVVRWHYEKPERLNEFENQAVEHNIVEWVLGRAKVEDAPTTFSELMGTTKT